MDSKQFSDCAKRLKEPLTADEADLRSAASRYYYACYHKCSALEGKYFAPMTEAESRDHKIFTTHRKLIYSIQNKSLNSAYDNQLKLLASKLGLILTLRGKADYDIDLVFERNEANHASNYSKSIFTILNQLTAE